MLIENCDEISKTPGLSEEFIRENSDKVNWVYISYYQILSEDFINEFSHKVYWDYISEYQKLSEEFIRKNSENLYWWPISSRQKLSENFIREFQYKVHWQLISIYQKLSEEFIREFSDKVHWAFILQIQKLSEEFIREFSDEVHWCNDSIETYQKLSPEFIQEWNLYIPETCWLYKDKEYKRKYIKENTGYEIIGDKVIAYKSCRADGYSKYNFQYLYEVGKEYESNADYNIDIENSFGLSAWTKDGALSYYREGKLFKVEIALEDLAAIVHEGKKIRASKIKIIEEINKTL
jgi:hypothetical protein